MNEMKKRDLMTGDIVVDRDGTLGIVIAEKEVIIYPESGMDYYDDITDDLLLNDDYRGGDIMAVYRDPYGGAINFIDYEDYDPVFEREDDVVWTPDMHWKNQQKIKAETAVSLPKKEYLCGVIQAYYGNRTGIEFTEENVDQLIAGHLNSEFCKGMTFDRSVIHLPGEEGLVLIYNKLEEEKRLQDKEKWFREKGYVLKPLAEIPEMDIKLYRRCLACRMSEEGKLESLREDDYEKVIKYLAE